MIPLSRCSSCGNLITPTEGPCPRCGSRELRSEAVRAVGTVLAATELSYPPEGFEPPHRLAFVELAESARLLAVVEGEVPALRSTVTVSTRGGLYYARG